MQAASPAAGTPTQTTTFERHYQATAYVTLLSITIFSRSGVGFGFAGTNVQEKGFEQNFSLRFLSGSTPERAPASTALALFKRTSKSVVALPSMPIISA